MFPTDLDMKVLYRERLREVDRITRVAEARALAPRTPERGQVARNARGPLALDWLLRMILRAGAV